MEKNGATTQSNGGYYVHCIIIGINLQMMPSERSE